MTETSTRRVALVTGSTSGIGLAIARRLAADGLDVVIHGLDASGEELARTTRDECGVRTWVSAANLLDRVELGGMVREAKAQLGGIHVLVNNAGMQFVAPIEDFPDEKWDAILALNLSAAFLLSRSVWPEMKARGGGRIVNIASVHGLRGSDFK